MPRPAPLAFDPRAQQPQCGDRHHRGTDALEQQADREQHLAVCDGDREAAHNEERHRDPEDLALAQPVTEEPGDEHHENGGDAGDRQRRAHLVVGEVQIGQHRRQNVVEARGDAHAHARHHAHAQNQSTPVGCWPQG